MIERSDVDAAMARLVAVLEPRVGKRMTRVVIANLARVAETGGVDAVMGSIHATLDAYARIPPSGTPFPLDVAKAIADAGCLKLPFLNARRSFPKLAPREITMTDGEAAAIAQHADALLPSYGDDDAEFAVRVAYKNAHHYRLHLVVGRAYNRNEPLPTTLLDDAWRAQGAARSAEAGVPIAVVPEDVGAPGVIYAHGDTSVDVKKRFRARGFSFEPNRGDPISLDDIGGVARFLAAHPLPIAPHTLAWLVHLVRFAFPNVAVDVDDALTVDWEPLEERASSAASLLLGIVPEAPASREKIRLRAGDTVLDYAPGVLVVG